MPRCAKVWAVGYRRWGRAECVGFPVEQIWQGGGAIRQPTTPKKEAGILISTITQSPTVYLHTRP
jgi:hypothetical protein